MVAQLLRGGSAIQIGHSKFRKPVSDYHPGRGSLGVRILQRKAARSALLPYQRRSLCRQCDNRRRHDEMGDRGNTLVDTSLVRLDAQVLDPASCKPAPSLGFGINVSH